MIEDIRARLAELSEPEYAAFNKKLIPGDFAILGVRSPALKKLAKEIAKSRDWRAFLQQANEQTHEETMLQALVVCMADMPVDERFDYIKWFIPKINNWAVCDSFCGGLGKFAGKNAARMWEFLVPYGASGREYDVRFSMVMPLQFINEEYIDRVLAHLDTLKHSGYYAQMGAAWTLSFCCIHFLDKSMTYLQSDSLDDFTHNKAIQKARESYRISPEDKERLNALKRKRIKV